MFNKKESLFWPAEVSTPWQVVPVRALYVQSCPTLGKLKSNYRNIKTVSFFNLYRIRNITVLVLF